MGKRCQLIISHITVPPYSLRYDVNYTKIDGNKNFATGNRTVAMNINEAMKGSLSGVLCSNIYAQTLPLHACAERVGCVALHLPVGFRLCVKE